MEHAIPLFAAILLTRLLASEAQYQRARRSGNQVYFPVGVGLRLTFGIGGPFLLYVSYRLALDSRQTGEWWLPVLSGCLAAGTIVFRPPEIKIDPRGIHEFGLLGLRQKLVPWAGAAASSIPGLREVLVIGQDGTTIKHAAHHVGQREFLFELERHHVHPLMTWRLKNRKTEKPGTGYWTAPLS